MESIPIILIFSGIVFIGMGIQTIIKYSTCEDKKEKLVWKHTIIIYLLLALFTIVIGAMMIKWL